MKTIVKTLAMLLTALTAATASAQQSNEATQEQQQTTTTEGERPALTLNPKSLKVSGGIDLVSAHLWRGTKLAEQSLMPHGEVSWRGLSLSAGATLPLHKDETKEIRLRLGYSLYGFNVGLTDYWHSGIDERDRFFVKENGDGPNKLEANIGYTCKWFSLQAYTFFFGNDFLPFINIPGNRQKRAYSTYVELNVPFRVGGVDLDASMGITPFKSAGHYTITVEQDGNQLKPIVQGDYFYAGGFSCIKAALRGTKTIQITQGVRLPVFVELHTNPYMQTVDMMCGLGVRF